ncbi:hypothetical protein T439DRAFT_344282 [Meredithblackwellia eburnea MCA 4105]
MPIEQNFMKRRGVGTIGVDEETAFDGLTLVAPLTGKDVFLVDNEGKEAHKWTFDMRIGRHARLLANGSLAVNLKLPPSQAPAPFPFFNKYGGGRYVQVDHTGKVLREHIDVLGHHDAFHTEDGRLLYTALQALTVDQAAALPGGVPGTEAPDGKVYSDTIKEVDMATGKVLWEWKACEKLDPKVFPLQVHYPREQWPLINAVSFLKDGNVLCSLRSVSAVIIIEKKTGNVVWHLDSSVVAQQHCANELPNGNILIYDNGAFREGISWQYSRGLEVSRANKEIVWQWTAPTKEWFYSPFMGSAQRLPNGNTLLCESAFGRLLEINTKDEVCWEYVCPYFAQYPEKEVRAVFATESNALFRAYKYDRAEFPWLKASQQKAGGCHIA